MRLLQLALPVVLLTSTSLAAAKVIVFKGARIHTVAGPVIEDGVLVIADGKIVAVGDSKQTPLPAGAEVRDVSGKTIIPGLVDSHSHLGVASRPHVPSNSDGNERTGAVQAIVRAIDSALSGEIELRPEDGLYPMPYMALQANGDPWEEECATPGAGDACARQGFYPDGSRSFEEIDRLSVGDDGRASLISSVADVDFYRGLPPGGYRNGLAENLRTDQGEGHTHRHETAPGSQSQVTMPIVRGSHDETGRGYGASQHSHAFNSPARQ